MVARSRETGQEFSAAIQMTSEGLEARVATVEVVLSGDFWAGWMWSRRGREASVSVFCV